jgi:hypothetical protein
MTAGMMTKPQRDHVQDLTELIGHYLFVQVTYMQPEGREEEIEFIGQVTGVHPVVTVDRPGSAAPFALPPDARWFRAIPRSAFAPESLAETALSPRFETHWRVRAPKDGARGPFPGPFKPKPG